MHPAGRPSTIGIRRIPLPPPRERDTTPSKECPTLRDLDWLAGGQAVARLTTTEFFDEEFLGGAQIEMRRIIVDDEPKKPREKRVRPAAWQKTLWLPEAKRTSQAPGEENIAHKGIAAPLHKLLVEQTHAEWMRLSDKSIPEPEREQMIEQMLRERVAIGGTPTELAELAEFAGNAEAPGYVARQARRVSRRGGLSGGLAEEERARTGLRGTPFAEILYDWWVGYDRYMTGLRRLDMPCRDRPTDNPITIPHDGFLKLIEAIIGQAWLDVRGIPVNSGKEDEEKVPRKTQAEAKKFLDDLQKQAKTEMNRRPRPAPELRIPPLGTKYTPNIWRGIFEFIAYRGGKPDYKRLGSLTGKSPGHIRKLRSQWMNGVGMFAER